MLSNRLRFSQWFGPAWAGHVSSSLDRINLTILVLAFFLFPDSRCFPLFGLLLPQTPFLLSPHVETLSARATMSTFQWLCTLSGF